MPLGDRQENDLVHITLDVWQDKVYYLGKEYPAGYFAAGVLNVSHNLFVTITGEGGFLLDAYAIAKFGDREPVSYTHLDVYKRQGIACADTASPDQNGESILFHPV